MQGWDIIYGQRVSKKYDYNPGSDYSGDFLISYFTTYDYDASGRLIRESRLETYTESAECTYETIYLYDESGVIGCVVKNDFGEIGTYYFQRNLQGDVIAIYNASGAKQAEFAYDAYGNCTITYGAYSIASQCSSIRYRGYVYDSEIGLYYLNSRYYNPEWRRFISPDDTSYLDPETPNGLNLYCYCNNDPVNFVDPSGHEPKWLAWLLSGISITAGIVLSATGVGSILGGVLIGAGAGSLINGYVNEANGGSFLAGYIGGAISGALCGVGAGWAGSLYISATATSGLATLGLIGASMATSFSFGFIGNMSGTLATALMDKQPVNTKSLIHSSIIMGALNIFAGFGSGVSSEIANLGQFAVDANSQWAHRLLAGTIAGATEAFYDTTSYLYGFLN